MDDNPLFALWPVHSSTWAAWLDRIRLGNTNSALMVTILRALNRFVCVDGVLGVSSGQRTRSIECLIDLRFEIERCRRGRASPHVENDACLGFLSAELNRIPQSSFKDLCDNVPTWEWDVEEAVTFDVVGLEHLLSGLGFASVNATRGLTHGVLGADLVEREQVLRFIRRCSEFADGRSGLRLTVIDRYLVDISSKDGRIRFRTAMHSLLDQATSRDSRIREIHLYVSPSHADLEPVNAEIRSVLGGWAPAADTHTIKLSVYLSCHADTRYGFSKNSHHRSFIVEPLGIPHGTVCIGAWLSDRGFSVLVDDDDDDGLHFTHIMNRMERTVAKRTLCAITKAELRYSNRRYDVPARPSATP